MTPPMLSRNIPAFILAKASFVYCPKKKEASFVCVGILIFSFDMTHYCIFCVIYKYDKFKGWRIKNKIVQKVSCPLIVIVLFLFSFSAFVTCCHILMSAILIVSIIFFSYFHIRFSSTFFRRNGDLLCSSSFFNQ